MKKILLGMSGGVDSSVAACLLLEQGFEVIGATIKIWLPKHETSDEYEPPGISDARQMAAFLGLPHYTIDVRDDFKKTVIGNFVSEYAQGRTPNPCVVCNRFIKWKYLWDKAKDLGADHIATGHYAHVDTHPNSGRPCIKAANNKDQSYTLYSLSQDQIVGAQLPIGDYSKDVIREVAAKYNLPVANKPDSQDICFIPDGNYSEFIEELSHPSPEGCFLDEKGNILGKHKGLIRYTVGQRKGLGIALGKPMYVKSISASENSVTLSDDISVSEMLVGDVNWMGIESFVGERSFQVKIRYNHKAVGCVAQVIYDGGKEKISCRFDKPQRAVTPGQSAVFYDGAYIAFGGVIY